jgi:hypothetical protein
MDNSLGKKVKYMRRRTSIVPYEPHRIVSFQELDTFLGDDFVLLCGSAISARMEYEGDGFIKFLPMGETVTEKFFFNLHDYLKNGNYPERLLSRYALELVSGKYSYKRQKRKFEDFLWQLDKQQDGISVSKLLYSLYFCDPGQFLLNHIAITNLLTSRRVKLCLTTNFDNAIENSNPNIIISVHKDGFVMNSMPNNPTLLKLHGDVKDGSYRATIPQLYSAEQAKSYYYLEELLEKKVILVVGYSGNGDIDIAPHLKQAKELGARLVWLVKQDNFSDIATDWFVSDLFSSSCDKNWLLRLGGIVDQDLSSINRIAPPWETRLNEWCKSTFSSITLQQSIELVDVISGMAKFHFYYVNKWDSRKKGVNINKDKDLLDFAITCLGIGTYYSSLVAIRKIDRKNIKKLGLYDELLYTKGFSNWRLIRLMEASNTLRYFSYLGEDDQLEEQQVDILRVYIEVLREIINSYNRKVDARNFYYDHQVNEACGSLLSLMKKSNNPTSRMLSNLVVFDIERMVGIKTHTNDYQEIYQRAVDLKLYGIARAAARSIIRINLIEGIKKMVYINKIADETWAWHSIKHNSLAVFDWIPKLIINPAYIANIVLSRLPVLIREFALMFKKVLWRITYKLNIVITE